MNCADSHLNLVNYSLIVFYYNWLFVNFCLVLKLVVVNCKIVVLDQLQFLNLQIKTNNLLLVNLGVVAPFFFCILLFFNPYKAFLFRANKDLTVYACDCSDETLERANEIISDASTVASFQHRFRTFCCDLSTSGFPNWLACDPCRDKFLQKQSYCLSGYFAIPFMLLNYSIYAMTS